MEKISMREEYAAQELVDKARLKELLLDARGEDRTMAEFAACCGLTPTMLSRIVRGHLSRPMSPDVIEKICANAAPTSTVTFEDFAIANGMRLKADMTGMGGMTAPRKNNARNTRRCTNILWKAIFDRGIAVAKTSAESIGLLNADLVLRVPEVESLYWGFVAVNPPAVCPHTDAWKTSAAAMSIFLEDVWTPEKYKDTKVSFVFDDKDFFEKFLASLEGVSVNNDISLLLLDTEEEDVVGEYTLPRKDGTTLDGKSVFELPRIADEDNSDPSLF